MRVTGSQARVPVIAAAVAALVAALMLLIAPVYEGGGTLIEENGVGIAWVIVLPLALALLPLMVSARRRPAATWTAAILLLMMSFLSSAGIFFLPAALILVIAAYGTRARPEPPARSRAS